jgi:cardiolipin synthase
MLELIKHFWPHFAAALLLAMDAWAIGHAVLYKRDSRSAVGWSGIILVFPLLGAILYLLLGINRIQRRAAHLRGRAAPAELPPDHTSDESVLIRHLPDQADHLATLARIVRSITSRPLLSGNHLRLLRNGDQAYPAMLDAIAGAQTSITLSSYIFAHDASGLAFVEALAAAVRRGVEVRVLIDDVGARYSFPPITGLLQRRGVRTATFMPTFFHWRMPYGNLRNHRKLLVVDGRRGFTGGLNIRHNNVTTAGGRDATRDLHTEVEGPVIRHLQEAFAEDWAFTTGERLEGERWFPNIAPAGGVPARGITDGPDEDYDKLRRVLMGALACARHRVRIVTPYFLPDNALVSQINITALRGVPVDILIPRHNNLRLVSWACMAQLWQVLERGCRVWRTEAPFDHSKIMVVDDAWCMLGSGNWDPRSLRLNFEFNVEAYDPLLAQELNDLIDQKMANAQPLTLADVDGRSLPVRLRDGVARLFSPYL